MRKILFATTLLVSLNISAQKTTKDSLVKKISDEVCIEMNKIVSEKRKIANLEVTLGLAMMPALGKYNKEIKEVYGYDALDDNENNKVTDDVGDYIATNCPAFLQIIAENSEATSRLISGENSGTGNIKGSFVKLTEAEFSYVEVKNAKGKLEKIYWMDFFDGATLLSEPNKLANKKVNVTYIEKEVYRVSIKEYVKIKVITGIELDKK